jgi:hypothetical protein
MSKLELLHEAITNYIPAEGAPLPEVIHDYERILNDMDKDDDKISYITLFLEAIIPKVIDEKTRAWALSIFNLILEKAYVEHVYLNHIDIKLEPVIEHVDEPLEPNPVVETPEVNQQEDTLAFTGDIIFLHFKIKEAIDIIKKYPSIFYESMYEFKSNSPTLILKLNAILTFDLDASKNIMMHIIFLDNPELYPKVKECIEHFKKKGHIEYINDEFINKLPLPIVDTLLQNNAILLNEQNKILYGENIEAILQLIKDGTRKLNFLFLNKMFYSYKDEHDNNLLLIAVANKKSYLSIIQLLTVIPYDICNRSGKNFLTLAYENGCDYFQDLLNNIHDEKIDIDFNLKDAHGNHVLSFISMCNYFRYDIDIYNSLINVPNHEGNTPLMLSLISKNIIFKNLLDDASIDVRIKNNMGQTALIIAVLNNINKEEFQQQLILAYKSSELPSDTISTAFDDIDHAGNSALMISVIVRCKPWFDALYKTSANKTLINLEGKSIYDDEYASFVEILYTDENLLWKNITLYKKEFNESLYNSILISYKNLSPEAKLTFKYYVEELPPSTPVIMRTNSYFHTDQGNEGTCYAHTFVRLMLQNIFKIKTDKSDIKHPECIKMLKTDPKEINKDRDDIFNARTCGPEIFLKTGLFLFMYYHIINIYGIVGIDPAKYYSMCNDLILFLNNIKYKFTKEEEIFSQAFLNRFKKGHIIYKTILDFLKGFTLPPISCTTVNLLDNLTSKENKSFALLIRYYLQNQMYVGLSYLSKRTSSGHIFLITGMNEMRKTFQIKNSWLEIESSILWKDIDKESKHYVFEGNVKTDLMFDDLIFIHPGKKIQEHIVETCKISSSSTKMDNLFKQTLLDISIPPDKKINHPFIGGKTKKYKTYHKKTRKF